PKPAENSADPSAVPRSSADPRFPQGADANESGEKKSEEDSGDFVAPAAAASRRPAARRHLSPAVELDPHQLLRRAGDDAGAAADRCRAAACLADADGPADGDGGRALRAVVAAVGRVAGSRA